MVDRSTVPDRLMVLLACEQNESDSLRHAWGQRPIDILLCADPAVALLRVGQYTPDLVIIGDSDGALGPIDFLLALRDAGIDTPVIVGSYSAEPELAARALAAGATAVMPRPFAPEEVLLRLASSLRGGGSFRPWPPSIDLGRLRIDGAVQRIWVDGKESLIPPMEFALLRYLAERHSEIVTRAELEMAGWPERATVPTNSLSVHLTRLRRRFPSAPGPTWIRPVRGIGYRLLVPGVIYSRAGGMHS